MEESIIRTETSGVVRLVLRLMRSQFKTCSDQPNRCSSGQGVHASCFLCLHVRVLLRHPIAVLSASIPSTSGSAQMVSASSLRDVSAFLE